MAQNKKLTPIQQYYYDEWENNVSTITNQTTSDNNILGELIVVGAIFAGTYTVASLIDAAQQGAIQNELVPPGELDTQKQSLELIGTTVLPYDATSGVTVDGDIYQYFLSSQDLTQYNQISQDLAQLGRVSDEKSIENISFNNAQAIQEQIGLLGAVEAERQAELNTWKALQDSGTNILIPWESEGDERVCDDCSALEAEDGFPPDEYPEPPHYGCRCSPGEPIIDLSGVEMP